MYDTVGMALQWTLAQSLGEACTADMAAAWNAAYDLLGSVMKEAKYEKDHGASVPSYVAR